ncbi:hypothetical protein DYBT9275_03001 [Dyadobacter sp. CECT 9275]|uniref:Pesticidal crystal protein Cry22Aa Ig-like domain-containing protein n=1 Tax=Dyadobacter helix TaxID=2822344 RepID=A0A916JBV3_9BACT|nr:immunoglobulin-like domain-containing protein [Dyadobacter sp. CECT 9275]CAG5002927.1 hypothetical protein DYBT9275_03001 [Dyadobacter sp. CECT 9275]
MKRQLKYIAIAFVGVLGLSCEPDKVTEGISDITYFPEFDYKGDEVVLASCGTAFTDPGVTAVENGADIPVNTTVSAMISGGTVASVPTTADRYTVNYRAVNKDGYPANASRVVWTACTGDLKTSIEGLYTSTVFRNAVSGAQYTNMKYILIRKKPGTENTYQISDAIGGWYQLGRALGDAYLAPGLEVTATNIGTNSFTFGGAPQVLGFGGPVTPKSLTVDPATKTIVLTTAWNVYEFVATLKQVSF